MLEIQKRIAPADMEFSRQLCNNLYDSIDPLLTELQQAWEAHYREGSEHAGTIRELRSDYLNVSDELNKVQ